MDWYCPNAPKQVKLADHGDTLRGQYLAAELDRLSKKVSALRAQAAGGGPEGAISRFRGEIRRMILTLPATETMRRMSMVELEKVGSRVAEIEALAHRYRASRLSEIMGTGQGD